MRCDDEKMRAQISFFIVAFAVCTSTEAAVSTKRRCVDENCTVPISLAKTLVKYSAPEPGILSFSSGEEVKIFSKEAGDNLELWGVELRGKRGYVPRSLVKETKMFNHKAELVVDTGFKSAQEVPSSNNLESDKIIIDGTTLYNISPSSTQDSLHSHSQQSTAVPELPEKQDYQESKEEMINIDEIKKEKIENVDMQPKPQEIKESDKDKEEVLQGVEEDEDDDIEIEGEDDVDDDEEDEDEDDEDDEFIEKETVTDKPVDINTNNDIHINEETKVVDSQHEVEQPETKEQHDKKDSERESEVKGEPEVLPITEAPPTLTQTPPPPTKLPLFFRHANAGMQDSGMPASAQVPSLPDSVVNIESTADNKSLEVEAVEKNVNIENEPVKEIKKTLPDENENKHVESIGIGPPLSETNINDSYTNNFEVKTAFTDTFEAAIPASAEIKETEEILTDVPPPPLNLYETTPSPEEELSAQSTQSSETEDSTAAKIEEPSTTTEEPSFFGGFFSQPTVPDVPAGQDTTPPTEEPSSIEEEILTQTTAYTTTEPDAINIVDERKPNSAEIETLTESGDTQTQGYVVTDPSPSWNFGEIDATTENPGFAGNVVEVTEHYEQQEGEITSNVETVAINEEDNHTEKISEDNGDNSGGWYDSLVNFFGVNEEASVVEDAPKFTESKYEEVNDDVLLSQYASHNNRDSCPADDAQCQSTASHSNAHSDPPSEESTMSSILDMFELNDTLMIVAISGGCVVLFLWGYMLIEKMRKEGPLVGKINQLEHQLLIMAKENEVLNNKAEDAKNSRQEINENVSSELVLELQKELDEAQNNRLALEDQIQSLEKELENSTEVGLELNKMLSEVLNSQNGSDTVMANIEQLQKQLVEQQSTINSVNDKLNEKDTENHELQLELEINNKKVVDLQAELEKMMLNLIKAEEDKEVSVSKTEGQVSSLRENLSKMKASSTAEIAQLTKQLSDIKLQFAEAQRNFEVKAKEYNLLKEGLTESDANKHVVEQSTLKAELMQLQQDNKSLVERLGHEQIIGKNFQSEVKHLGDEKLLLRKQYEEADREKLEALTKLDVLSTYFKEKEEALQRELSKHEAMWSEKQGENTTTSERMKFMQAEIQNFKSQVTSLQQEIVSQEVDLKSQISVLEKKAHENWVAARQAERRIEDARQEAAQLRNRLTLRERSLIEEKSQNRNGMSPLETNGVDHHLNDTASPPLLFGAREHMTTSPPLLPGLPPGFPMPPPPGVGVPPFLPPFMTGMPPPPGVFPGDHRPPPLGRMSSPPLNSRYTPDSRAFSPYDRRSPSPTDDDYYDRDDRDYYSHRPKRNNGRRSGYSTGSNSNESLDKLDRHSHSKV